MALLRWVSHIFRRISQTPIIAGFIIASYDGCLGYSVELGDAQRKALRCPLTIDLVDVGYSYYSHGISDTHHSQAAWGSDGPPGPSWAEPLWASRALMRRAASVVLDSALAVVAGLHCFL